MCQHQQSSQEMNCGKREKKRQSKIQVTTMNAKHVAGSSHTT
jgi:hypothetical protein